MTISKLLPQANEAEPSVNHTSRTAQHVVRQLAHYQLELHIVAGQANHDL